MGIDTAIYVAVISGVVALIVGYMARGKNKAEADKTIGESWQGLIKPMQDRIAELEKDYEKAGQEIARLTAAITMMQQTISAQNATIRKQEGQIRVLIAQVQAHGDDPFTIPDNRV